SVEPKAYTAGVGPGGTRVADPHYGQTVRVVVPTRNQRSLLTNCIGSLRAKASNCNRLEFVVVDNASEDSDTRSYLDVLHREGAAQVIRDGRPFNWALFNNAAVEGSEAALFVFCNNDIEMLSSNWDQRIEDSLAVENIGVI